ncbi:unnamed protein product [Kuraishia capsulata CBS 1993]|uniref:threonine--tRNA ligase n=1 Tax=Kuraishia capsulata CBS 1993 TaxID=1382522 RepID=W6MIZ3_9ASCO|nr:uncharacterized protein KUCA_T00000328001 [Kuraishia capsulata CBS 1993]CDK24367.1 unnamed protein product [Kuraishia capsulata CBS 1993]
MPVKHFEPQAGMNVLHSNLLTFSLAMFKLRRSTQLLIRCHSTTSTKNASIGQRQQLFMVDEASPGSVFFLPHGTRIFNKLVQFMKVQQARYGFQEVISPLIYKKALWETSGHWDKYKEDMFKVEGFENNDCDGNHTYGLKPMNCPGHCVIFNSTLRSYQDLPVRMSDWSSLHRNEASGGLTGLTRVRRFHQDDGHIFCTRQQVGEEIAKSLRLVKLVYGVFGMDNYRMTFSSRPDEHIGSEQEWDEAEHQLTSVLDEVVGKENWNTRDKDGAFYGPKIDILLKDNFGKEHQIGTIQLDFQLPARFGLKYKGEDGELHQPVMIHRAVFGSVERFLALLIDHFDGKWPFWLSPRHAVVIPVNETHKEYAQKVAASISGELLEALDAPAILESHRFNVDVDNRSDTVGLKTREAIVKGYNYIIIVGDKEAEAGKVAMRSRDNRKIELLSPDEVRNMYIKLEESFE